MLARLDSSLSPALPLRKRCYSLLSVAEIGSKKRIVANHETMQREMEHDEYLYFGTNVNLTGGKSSNEWILSP